MFTGYIEKLLTERVEFLMRGSSFTISNKKEVQINLMTLSTVWASPLNENLLITKLMSWAAYPRHCTEAI